MDSLEHSYSKDPSIVSREIAGETILVPIHQNVGDLESIYTLNETGAFAWKLMDGERTLSEILNRIINDYLVDDDEAEKDLLELIAQLEEIGAVREV